MSGHQIIVAKGAPRSPSIRHSITTDGDGDVIMADAPPANNVLQRAGAFYRDQVHPTVQPKFTYVANSVKRGVKRGCDALDDTLRDVFQRCHTCKELSFKRFKRLPIEDNRVTSKAILQDTLPVDYLKTFHPESLTWARDTFAYLGASNHNNAMKFIDDLIHKMLHNKFDYISLIRDRCDPDNNPYSNIPKTIPTEKMTNEPKDKCPNLTVLLHNHMIEMFDDNSPELFHKSGLRFLENLVNFKGQYISLYANRGRLPLYEKYGLSPLGTMRFPYDQYNADPISERNNLLRMIETAQFILSHRNMFDVSFPGHTLAGVIADIDAIRMDELPPSYVDWPGKYASLPGTYPDDDFHNSLMDTVAIQDYEVKRMWDHWHPTPHKDDLAKAQYRTPVRRAMKLNDIIYDIKGNPQAAKGALKKELERQGTPVPKQTHFLSPGPAWYHPPEHIPLAKQEPLVKKKPALKQKRTELGHSLGLSKMERLRMELRAKSPNDILKSALKVPTTTKVDNTEMDETEVATANKVQKTKFTTRVKAEVDNAAAQKPNKATQMTAVSSWPKGEYHDMAPDYKGRKPRPNTSRMGKRTIEELLDDDPYEDLFRMPQWKMDKMECAKQLQDEAEYRTERMAAEKKREELERIAKEERKKIERLEAEQREKERKGAERLAEKQRLAEEQRRAEEEQIAQQRRIAEEQERIAEEERIKDEHKVTEPGHLRKPSKPLVTNLSPEWTDRVLDILHSVDTREIVKTPEGTALRLKDFETLIPRNEWLNDEIINGTIAHTVNYVNQKAGIKNTRTHTPKIQYMNSLAAKTVADGGEPSPRALRRLGIYPSNFFDIDSIFLPINRNKHWTLLVVRPKSRQILHLDSLNPQGNIALKNCALKWVRGFLGASFVESEWSLNNIASAQQYNGVDCGVHVITNSICVALGIDPDSYTTSEMPMQRLRIAAVLLNGGFKGEFDLDGY